MKLRKIKPAISNHQFDILNALCDDYLIVQRGTKQGALVYIDEAEIKNYHKLITVVKRNTIQNLLKKKLIELKERENWGKLFSISKFGTDLLLSHSN